MSKKRKIIEGKHCLITCILFLSGMLILGCRTSQGESGYVPELQSFRVDVNFMHPRRWSSRSVWDYWIVVRADSIECHLPYMGVKYQADFHDEGLNFCVPIISAERGRGRKGQAETVLTFRRNITGYQLHISLFPGGRANLYLTPSNGDAISYDGDWQAL